MQFKIKINLITMHPRYDPETIRGKSRKNQKIQNREPFFAQYKKGKRKFQNHPNEKTSFWTCTVHIKQKEYIQSHEVTIPSVPNLLQVKQLYQSIPLKIPNTTSTHIFHSPTNITIYQQSKENVSFTLTTISQETKIRKEKQHRTSHHTAHLRHKLKT